MIYRSWAEAAAAPENQPAEVFRARVVAGEIEIDRQESIEVVDGKRVRSDGLQHIGDDLAGRGAAFMAGNGTVIFLPMRLPDGWPDGLPLPPDTALYSNGDGTCSPKPEAVKDMAKTITDWTEAAPTADLRIAIPPENLPFFEEQLRKTYGPTATPEPSSSASPSEPEPSKP